MVWALQVVQLPVWFEAEHHLDIALHRRRNTILMTPPMVIEGITAVWLYSVAPTALILLVIIWIVTFARIIPLFRRLSSGYDRGVVQQLISWNWVRTVCWTVRGGIMLWTVVYQGGA